MKKIHFTICYILICVIVIFMAFATYAYIKVNNVEEEIKTNDVEGLEIVFNDTSNLSLINLNRDETIIKKFSIKNISDTDLYYDINFDEVTNNYNITDNFYYSLESDNAGLVNYHLIPSENMLIASDILIKKGEKHEYKLIVNYVFNEELNKTFSSKILITLNNDNHEISKNSLISKIKEELKGSANSNEFNNNVDGVYYTNSSTNGKTIYFYRGSNNLKNNLVIDNTCYKILRTTENGGIRLIYNGTVSSDCIDNVIEEETEYNTLSNYNAYVGYMFGSPSSSIYESEHENKSSSNVKSYVDKWFINSFQGEKDFLDYNSFYCSNRKTRKFNINNILYDSKGFGTYNTGYIRMYDYYLNKENVSFNCDNASDRLSSDKSLSYPVGLITVEEAYYSGFDNDTENNYLYSNKSYWTMSSAYFNTDAYVFAIKDKEIVPEKVNEKNYVRPVITINNCDIISGDGSKTNPYKIK